jgi:two-component system CheB/CheR fusion protein
VKTYGLGLNSIRWRFTLASAVLTLAGVLVRELAGGDRSSLTLSGLLSLGLVVAGVAAATFAMASRLTSMIAALKRSTDAIAAGDFDAAVDIDCACEIGGLANSFHRMALRLNANVMRINTLAYTDAITALPNRSVIDHLLHYALAQPPGTFQAAIVFIDLDGFKRINDTLGHEGGDILLLQASRRILEHGLGSSIETLDTCTDSFGNPCDRLPEDVVFARFAGDEFVAVLPGRTDHAELSRLGQRIIDSLREPFQIKGHEVTVGASVGIAITPDDAVDAAELISFADMAMYSSKQAGKSCYRFFDRQVREALLERNRLEADLRLALQRGELLLHFQPQLQTSSLQLWGVEALVRWLHPERGLLMPGHFIDVAEQAGLMSALGQEVLRLAVAQCRRWLDAGQPQVVAVNVSPSQFADPQFVAVVLGTLRQANVSPQWISIEITESMAMTDFDSTARRLAVLREAGVRVAIDDFGIGFSNLSQLSRLPVDELKIDRSLISEIGSNAKSEAIIRATIGMARALGYRTIAEGIETTAQLNFLTAQGCDMLQGYLFGRPMAPGQFDQWLLRQHEERSLECVI